MPESERPYTSEELIADPERFWKPVSAEAMILDISLFGTGAFKGPPAQEKGDIAAAGYPPNGKTE